MTLPDEIRLRIERFIAEGRSGSITLQVRSGTVEMAEVRECIRASGKDARGRFDKERVRAVISR